MADKNQILLVDDDPNLVVTLGDFLSFEGYEIITANCAEQGLKRLEEHDPDLVILDMVMPRMNGQETFEKIRQLEPEMKVLLSSGYNKESQIEELMEKGCNGFILKPFDVATLSGKINRLFKQLQKA